MKGTTECGYCWFEFVCVCTCSLWWVETDHGITLQSSCMSGDRLLPDVEFRQICWLLPKMQEGLRNMFITLGVGLRQMDIGIDINWINGGTNRKVWEPK